MRPRIQTKRRVEYARGYLALEMVSEALRELEQIDREARSEVDVLEVLVDVLMEQKNWERVVREGAQLCAKSPESERGWIAWAYALRELQQIVEAREVLLRGEALHGASCGVLHYNLACYYCLLGDIEEADRRLRRACSMDPNWRDAAMDDPDLKGLRPRLEARD